MSDFYGNSYSQNSLEEKTKNIEKLDFDTLEIEKVPYTLICNKVIQNISNHFAGFIWVFLQTLPPNWNVNKKHIMNHFGISERTYQRHMSFLSASNLISYERYRLKNGTLGPVTLKVLNGTKFNADVASNHIAKFDIVVKDSDSNHTAKNPHSGEMAPLQIQHLKSLKNTTTCGSGKSKNFEQLKSKSKITVKQISVIKTDISDPSYDSSIPTASPGGTSPNVSDQEIVDVYLEMMPEMPRIKVIRPELKSQLNLMRQTWPLYQKDGEAFSIKSFRNYLQVIRDSFPWFLNKYINNKGFLSINSLGTLISPDNLAKVVNGEYCAKVY